MIPVSAGREGLFLFLFLVQYVGGVLSIGYLVRSNPDIDYLEGAKLLAPLIIVAAAHSVMIVEGIPMLAERFLKRKYNEGKAEANRAWEEWLKRKEEAEEKGEVFDEPPPSISMAMSQKD